jgi:hypothetical protein
VVVKANRRIRRLMPEEWRGAFSQALLHLYDFEFLEDSPLTALLPSTITIDNRMLFARGQALSAYLADEFLPAMISRFSTQDTRLRRMRETLEGVAQSKSIAQISREHGKSREFWHRAIWGPCCEVCIHEWLAQNAR